MALKLEATNFGSVTPQDWARLAKENDRPDADGIFLSCTNTRQIEAIADIEKMLGKPVVNSNQAVLWGAVKRLSAKVGAVKPMPQLGTIDGEFERLPGPAESIASDRLEGWDVRCGHPSDALRRSSG